jgi:DNA-binding MarR family transcriptional regulator
VLGAVLGEPLTVAGIAREMGITRQSVQRIADILAERGLAEYLPNPAHRRAKLLTPTAAGRAAIARIGPGHAAAAGRLAKALGEQPLADAVAALHALSAALDKAIVGVCRATR